ncbi:lysine N(6)-hydroxylase/L-ornithine N(5)-oxygenase family protein [Bacillus alkalisoli]|uniref:lysine N(6)-hydroxylase/L-ornithine N(5)-oxygenase family protein n=1 Tax=Bacillus alkalisoli TaxID=2011008 RepID=UPI000C243D1D|nr:SidA/IucD/PvdA family monooxygenase [Bacillus alkalisoli]
MKIYDCIGVGIGPFNLGLASLLAGQDTVSSIFFDKEDSFEWHPGMLIEQSDLQVPFIADLVSFADPTSPYSFLNYLHKTNRLYAFYYYRRFDIPRREYNRYAKWVVNQLDNCHFGHSVVGLNYKKLEEENVYEVIIKHTNSNEEKVYKARHIVLGTGSVPFIPDSLRESINKNVFHTSDYLTYEKELKQSNSILVVGSGQSAAEIFYELLRDQTKYNYSIKWVTRAFNFLQIDSGKLSQELFSPDYVNYFTALEYDTRREALENLHLLRNGVDPETLRKIYDLLYNRSVDGKDEKIMIQPLSEVKNIKELDGEISVDCYQWQAKKTFNLKVDKVILATGYKPEIPSWIWNQKDKIEWESENEFKVDSNFRIKFKDNRDNHFYTLTNIEHSHGTGATNLSLSVMRNQLIINDIAQKEIYPVQMNTIFQQFLPE